MQRHAHLVRHLQNAEHAANHNATKPRCLRSGRSRRSRRSRREPPPPSCTCGPRRRRSSSSSGWLGAAGAVAVVAAAVVVAEARVAAVTAAAAVAAAEAPWQARPLRRRAVLWRWPQRAWCGGCGNAGRLCVLCSCPRQCPVFTRPVGAEFSRDLCRTSRANSKAQPKVPLFACVFGFWFTWLGQLAGYFSAGPCLPSGEPTAPPRAAKASRPSAENGGGWPTPPLRRCTFGCERASAGMLRLRPSETVP